jgi:hypothetical protein
LSYDRHLEFRNYKFKFREVARVGLEPTTYGL